MNQTMLFDDTAALPAREAASAAAHPADARSTGAAGEPSQHAGPKRTAGRRLAALGLAALAAAAAWYATGGLHGRPGSLSGGGALPANNAALTPNPADALVARTRTVTADDLLGGNFASSTPEGRLMQLYAHLAAAPSTAEDSADMLIQARRLAADVPTFALAQLAYADLLSAQGSAAKGFAMLPPGQVAGSAERLEELLSEARARVGGTAHRPAPGTLPEQLVFLSPNVRHAVAVDVSHSRVYLFENTADGPVLKRDYYASIGKLGTSKRSEGDMRTPLGVYFVTGQIVRPRLSDRFGEKALTLNYPNQYDQMHGRTGSGIWMHGVERAMFSRAPLATDGCVALSNVDLQEISGFIEKQGTPIVIADKLNWVKSTRTASPDNGFMKAFDAWRVARQTAGLDAQLKFYSPNQRTPAVASAASWADLLRADREKPGAPAPSVDNLSVVGFHDQSDVMIVTYTEAGAGSPHGRLKRQYWAHEPAGWAIIYEGAIG